MANFIEGSLEDRDDILYISKELVDWKTEGKQSVNAFCVANSISNRTPMDILRGVCKKTGVELKIRVDY